MRPFCVVVQPPLLDDDLRLLEAVEDFAVQYFISPFPVEASVVSVLPRAPWLDEQGVVSPDVV